MDVDRLMNDKREVLERFLKQIDTSIGLATFFNRLEDSAVLRSLFLLHPQELFMTENKLSLPILVWSSDVPDTHSAGRTVLSLFRDIAITRAETASRQFPFLEHTKLPKELANIIVYTAFRIARTNSDVRELITGDFSFSKMKAVLGENNEKLRDMMNAMTNEDLDPMLTHMINAFKHASGQWVQSLMKNPLAFLEQITNIMPNILLDVHLTASQHVSSLLETSGLQFHEYKQILTDLLSLGLIEKQDTVFRCDRCQGDLQVLTSTSRIAPSHMDINCPRCGRIMQSSSLIFLDNTLRECLQFSDGLLAVAVARLLQKNKFEYLAFERDDAYEYDFICTTPKTQLLIECKYHRRPQNNRSFIGMVKQDLSQTSKHMKTRNIPAAVIIYNYDLTGYEKLVDKYSFEYGVSLIGFGSVKEAFEGFKK
jgi:hypothetical protein